MSTLISSVRDYSDMLDWVRNYVIAKISADYRILVGQY